MSEKLVLVDSDILIDFIHADDKAADFIRELELNHDLGISVITQFELLAGCANKTEMARLRKFLDKFELIHMNKSVSEVAVRLFGKYRLSHGVMIPDTIIAATAISNKILLLTKNKKDFRFIEKLDLIPY